MSKMNYVGVALYYIDYFHPKTGKLADISEEGFTTLELCQAQINSENNEDEKFRQELLDNYEEQMRNFVLDLDTSDSEPAHPLLACWRYDKKRTSTFTMKTVTMRLPSIVSKIYSRSMLLPNRLNRLILFLMGYLIPGHTQRFRDGSMPVFTIPLQMN